MKLGLMRNWLLKMGPMHRCVGSKRICLRSVLGKMLLKYADYDGVYKSYHTAAYEFGKIYEYYLPEYWYKTN